MPSKRKEITKETSSMQHARTAKKPKRDPLTAQFEEITCAFEMLPLADEVKKMLAEVLPCSLGEFSDQRDKFQERVVEALASVFGDVEAALNVAVKTARSASDEANGNKPQHEKETTEAMENLNAAKAETLRLKVALAEKAMAFRAATDLLEEAERAKKLDSQASQEAVKKQGMLEGAFEKLKLLGTTLPDEVDAQKLRDDLFSFLHKQKFEESILIALPVALNKSPESRGQFDLIAITQLENDIGFRMAEQEAIVAAAKPGQEKCEAAVQDALQRLNAARVEQRAAAKNFDVASQQQSVCEEVSMKAQTALRELAESCKRLEKAVYAAEAEVELFQQGPKETFKALCSRVTPEPVVEEQAPVVDAQVEEQVEQAPQVEMLEAEVAAVAAC